MVINGSIDVPFHGPDGEKLTGPFHPAGEGDTAGAPEHFILRGGGQGHDFGLCRIGAILLSLPSANQANTLHRQITLLPSIAHQPAEINKRMQIQVHDRPVGSGNILEDEFHRY